MMAKVHMKTQGMIFTCGGLMIGGGFLVIAHLLGSNLC